MAAATSCPQCGSTVEIECKGHLEIFRCPDCGWEDSGTVFPGEEAALLGETRTVRVLLVWQDGRVTPKQILLAKKVVYRLASKTIKDILDESAASTAYDLGTFQEPQAHDLQKAAAAVGLKIILEPL